MHIVKLPSLSGQALNRIHCFAIMTYVTYYLTQLLFVNLKAAYKWTLFGIHSEEAQRLYISYKIYIGNVNLILKDFFLKYIDQWEWLTFLDAYVARDWKDSDKESYLTLVRVMNLDNKGKNIKIDMGNIWKLSLI